MLERFWLAFIPLFVAFDVIGLLPMYWALAHDVSASQRRQMVHVAIMVAFFVSAGFLVGSRWVFQTLGIGLADVFVAGGIILFVLTITDLIHPEKTFGGFAGSIDSLGAVPLGVPLIAGPAVLTTSLLVREQLGWRPTLAALSLNVLIVWAVLERAERLMNRLGPTGSRVLSKVASLLLAAFAVMLVRRGVQTMWPGPSSVAP